MVGVSHNFGGATGLTVKLLSTHRADKLAAAVGVSYFPGLGARAWGVDTGLGYTFQNGAVTQGYDWLHGQVQLALGAADTRSKKAVIQPRPLPSPQPPVDSPSPAPTPAPAPAHSEPPADAVPTDGGLRG